LLLIKIMLNLLFRKISKHLKNKKVTSKLQSKTLNLIQINHLTLKICILIIVLAYLIIAKMPASI